MYRSKYYTCEEIDERLLKGYYDDAVSKGYTGTFEQLQLELASVDLIDLNLLNSNAGYTLTEAVAKMDELSPVHPSIVRFRYTDKTYNKLRTLTYDSTKSDLSTKVTDISTYTLTLPEFNGDIFKSLLLEIGHIGFEGSMYITHYGIICGKVSIFGDTIGHIVNQRVLTNCVLSSDRTSLESFHNPTKIFKYERFFNLSNSSFQDRDGNIVPSHENSLWYTSTYEMVFDGEDADLDISDEQGNVITRFKNGHIQTQKFNSEVDGQISVVDGEDADLDISDEQGNVILRLKGGHISTKNFDSRMVAQYRPL